MGQGSSSSSVEQLGEQYVSPMSADEMVATATSLLDHPQWGPGLRNEIQKLDGRVVEKDLVRLQAEDLVRMWQSLVGLEAEACATGLALALLPLCGASQKGDLSVKCDDAQEEAVAAFYAALKLPACAVTDLTIHGAAFGTREAAAHLGHCLNVNSTIQKLTIGNVGGFCGEAVWTAFSHALTSNATLRRLELDGCYKSGDGFHVGATLADSHKLSALEHLRVYQGDERRRDGDLWGRTLRATLQDMEGWGTMLRHNCTITNLELLGFLLGQGGHQDGGLLVPVCEALLTNTILQKLVIGSSDVPQSLWHPVDSMEKVASTDDDALSLLDMLYINRTLTHLDIITSGIVCDARVVDRGLSRNSSLEELYISVDDMGALALMSALGTAGGATTNRRSQLGSLKCLGLGKRPHGYPYPFPSSAIRSQCFPSSIALRDMLASNQTLAKLDLTCAPYSSEKWVTHIFPALAGNHTLQELCLYQCPGIDGKFVYETLLELLDSNTCMTYIDLGATPLEDQGRAQVVESLIQENEQRAALKGVPTTLTTSCHLVFCGYPFAGKTTLLQSMILRHSSGNKRSARRQIDVQELRIDDLTMLVWKFTSQGLLHPLQDVIFPNATNVPTAFVFTFNPTIPTGRPRLKKEQQFKHEFLSWLKYICSRAKPPRNMRKPTVLVVVTHKDKILHIIEETKFHMMVEEWVHDVVWKFLDMITFDASSLFLLDATDKDDLDFTMFENHAIQLFHDRRIREVCRVPIICDDVAKALGGSLDPIISFADFQKLCESVVKASTIGHESQQKAFGTLMSRTKDKAARVIAAYLREAGEVLYFSDLDFLVRNLRWFAHGILGHLIDIVPQDNATATYNHLEGISQSASQVDSISGLVSEKFLAELLQRALDTVGLDPAGTSTDQLIQLMEKLDLCYKAGENYLMPALLPDKDGTAERGECNREWLLDLPSLTSKRIFVSRRLQCSDGLRTFITPGFFPRLQVVLQRKANEWNIEHTEACKLEKYFCRLRHRGMEILVEHSGSYDYFVDIMVKSYESREDTERFLKSEIIDEILRLCASSKGCQGVTLAEAIIRPDCVGEHIIPCRHRQSLLVADLKERMATVPTYKCYWGKVEDEKGTMLLPADIHDPQRLLDGVPEEAYDCYPDWNVKKGKKRGLAVIISMEKYHRRGGMSGAREERENMEALAHSLDFEVYAMVDYTAAQVIRALKFIAVEKVLEEHESFVCFVNAHEDSTHDDYEEYYFRDEDDEMLFLHSILRPFRHCKHLQDKPKLFFVNSCRGSNKLLADDEEQCGTSQQQQPWSQQVLKEPLKDLLIVFSTSARSVSTRYPQVGTSFVRALKNAFTNKRQILDVLGIVTSAANEVAAEEYKWMKEASGDVATLGQCPVYVSSLTKLLYWQ